MHRSTVHPPAHRPAHPSPARRRERGQATAEYALVLLGAAAVALLLVAWATDTDAIGRLLDGVLERILGQLS